MAFLDRSQIDRISDRAPPAPGKELVVGVLLAVLLATLAIRNLLPTDALAPAIVTLLFVIGAVTAGAAWLCSSRRFRVMWLDLAGSLTFIGIAISVLIEPDQIAGLFTLSDQPE
jgi:apolipoprotein N-acyltransferase